MQYDVALNGWELGGGSIRIWRKDLLERSFGLQGYTTEQSVDFDIVARATKAMPVIMWSTE